MVELSKRSEAHKAVMNEALKEWRKEMKKMKSETVVKYRFAAKGDKEIEKKYDVESGTVWHVINKSGEKYSVIIDADGLEAMSMPREREREMVDAWTEMVRNG